MHVPEQHTGMHYHEFMASLSQRRMTKRYLEVGVQAGMLMNRIHADIAVGVDPDYVIAANVAANKKRTCLIQSTSDEFFSNPFQMSALSTHPDLVFLDGYHTFEYLLRDFYNSEAIAHPNSLIVMHDCLPLDDIMVIRDIPTWTIKMEGTRFAHYWTGDVWKIIPILRKFRPDLTLRFIDCAPTGLVCVSKLDPTNRLLIENYPAIVQEFDRLPNTAEAIDEMYSTIRMTTAADAVGDAELFRPAGDVGSY